MSLLQQTAWPPEGGQTGALIRAKDWGATVLGPIERWPLSLKNAIDLVLATALPCAIHWGRDGILFYNDAAIELIGQRHPRVLGRPAVELNISEQIDWPGVTAAIRRGETVTIADQPYRLGPDGTHRHWFSHYVSPLRGDRGEIEGLWLISIDNTLRVSAERQRDTVETALRESEERHAFLLKLSDALRPLGSPAAVQAAATRILGEHLSVGRVCYAEMLSNGNDFIVERDYNTPGMPSVAGRHRLDSYGDMLASQFRAGQTIVIDDIRAEPMFTEMERTAYEYLRIRSFASTALVKEGQIVGLLSIHSATPREWSAGEVSLLKETAERTWAAVRRAQAESALRKSEERFRLMADAVPQIVWVADFQGRIQFFNQQWFNYTGSPKEPQTAADIAESYIHPDDIQPSLAAFNVARWTGSPLRVEQRMRSSDGHYRWFLVRAQPHRDPVTGVISQWFGASVDIHERRMVEAALRESEERFQQFGNASSDVLWIRDAGTLQWTYLTPAFETVYGLSREEALQGDNFHRWSNLILAEDRDEAVASIRRVAAGESVTFEYRIRRQSDGQIRWMRDTDFPLLDNAGNVSGIGGIGQDITDAREISDRLQALVAELQHRTRKLVGIVGTLADRTIGSVSTLDDFKQRFHERLEALGRFNCFLARIDRGETVTLRQLIDSELDAADLDSVASGRITLAGPEDLNLPAHMVQGLGLALHELMVNSRIHGALGQSQAALSVAWSVERGSVSGLAQLRIEWQELRLDPVHGQSEDGSVGCAVLEQGLLSHLHAEVRHSQGPDGPKCTITVPLSEAKSFKA